jgi:DNA mismatch repair protein MutL
MSVDPAPAPRVRKLPEELIRHIAAGEVVERPASVLKELIENAVDAGARRITVSWEEAGRKSLRVADDGVGMTPADARLALERHATSKIISLDDLTALGTYGFRGEALPSLAAVSRFELVTRTVGSAEAWSIRAEGGKVLREGPAGAPPGTTVVVEDLFFNTPARRKFLKSDATERGLLLRTVEDAAFASRAVDVQVFSEGKEVMNLRAAPPGATAEESLRLRLGHAWGEEKVAGLKRVRAEGRWLTVSGWISGVHAHEASARHQRFYINGRPVAHRRLSHALYDAYKGRLFVGRHPLAALFMDIDPSLVDVNVHPSKREVRLSNEGEVHDFLSRALQAALTESAQMPAASAPASFPSAARASDRPSWAESRAAYTIQSPPPARLPVTGPAPAPLGQPGFSVLAPAVEGEEGAPMTRDAFKDAVFEPLAQFDATYLLTRSEGRFYIFDQHAAAERVLYESLREAAEGRLPVRQALLLPWVWEVSAEAAAVIQERLPDLSRLGYDLEPFGPRAYRVKGVPGLLGDSPRVRELLEGLVEDLLSGVLPARWEALLIRAACRGSVRAGDPLQIVQMGKIIKDLQGCESPWSCPHGRPTFLRLEPTDLAKRFRRI